MRGRLVVASLLAASLSWLPPSTLLAESELEPRAVLAPQTAKTSLRSSDRIIIKFREGTRVRGQGKSLRSASPGAGGNLQALLSAHAIPPGALRRLHTRSEVELDQERSRGIERAGRELADLNLYYVLEVPRGRPATDLLERLNSLPVVEFAEAAPDPVPPPDLAAAGATPDLLALQGYLSDPPAGLGAVDPLAIAGGDGAGMTLVDIEYDWIFDHEDLDLPPSAMIDDAHPFNPFPESEADHGTASLGVVGARRNGLGVTGLAPAARLLAAPAFTEEFGYDLPRAISLATGRLRAGDVILIEQQVPVCDSDLFGPVEWSQAVYDAIATATALEIIVVQPAGNGAIDLDRPSCAGRFDRQVRNSRAIIVGAGEPATKSRVLPTAYGNRLDVQGWGAAVATAGFGDVFDPGDPRRRYTRNFSGTSSAAAMVTGAVLSLQGALKAEGLAVATPDEMRAALTATGSAQTGATRIGPLPNVKAALAWLREKRGVLPSWRGFESLGGALAVSEPDCLATTPIALDCWARTARGTLAWWRYGSGPLPVPVDLRGTVRSAPSCVQASGLLHCFVADPSRGLAHTFYRDGAWRGWIARGGTLASRPSCLSTDGIGIDCVVLATNGALRHRGISNGTWKNWVTLANSTRLRDPPTCFARKGGIDCLAVGNDNRAYTIRREINGTWSALQSLNGSVQGRASCIRTSTTPTCFFRGADRHLKRIIHDGTRWGSWTDFGGAMAADPSCALFGDSALFCVAPGVSGSLMEWRRTRTGSIGWRSLGGSLAASRLACSNAGGIDLDCFAVGRNTQLQHIAYR